MKFSLSLLVALFSVSVFGFVSDWNGYTLSPDYGALKTPAGKYAGGCSVIPAKKRDLVKIEVKDGKLVIDTRKFFGTDPKEEITVRFPVSGMIPDKRARLTAEVSAVPNAQFEMYFEGRDVPKGKDEHYWRSKICLASEEAQKFVSITSTRSARASSLRLLRRRRSTASRNALRTAVRSAGFTELHIPISNSSVRTRTGSITTIAASVFPAR